MSLGASFGFPSFSSKYSILTPSLRELYLAFGILRKKASALTKKSKPDFHRSPRIRTKKPLTMATTQIMNVGVIRFFHDVHAIFELRFEPTQLLKLLQTPLPLFPKQHGPIIHRYACVKKCTCRRNSSQTRERNNALFSEKKQRSFLGLQIN
jgi:hypothetical protein